MKLKKTVKQLVDEANAEIETLPVSDARDMTENDNFQFVDIRDVRELEREGMIPGAYHAPRGMLEFWVDPDSPYHKEVFSTGKKFVLYCQSNWRSALATKALQDMGLEQVAHLEGGFKAWKDGGLPVTKLASKKQ